MNRLILGHRPGHGMKFEIMTSSTTRRLDSLMPDWRDHFLARNLYCTDRPDVDQDLLDLMSLDIFVRDEDIQLIVTLGEDVTHQLVRRSRISPWLSWARAYAYVQVLKFPHPSGRNRWWNDPEHVKLARGALYDAAYRPLD